MARLVRAVVMLSVIAFTPSVAYAGDVEDMGGSELDPDLTGVDGSDQAGGASPADVVPDLTVVGESSAATQQFQLTGVWRLLALCESTGNPRAVSPGGTYRGLFQFDAQTWASVGGLASASRADLASPADQLAAAQRLQARRGWAPWPYCSRHLGLLR